MPGRSIFVLFLNDPTLAVIRYFSKFFKMSLLHKNDLNHALSMLLLIPFTILSICNFSIVEEKV